MFLLPRVLHLNNANLSLNCVNTKLNTVEGDVAHLVAQGIVSCCTVTTVFFQDLSQRVGT